MYLGTRDYVGFFWGVLNNIMIYEKLIEKQIEKNKGKINLKN